MLVYSQDFILAESSNFAEWSTNHCLFFPRNPDIFSRTPFRFLLKKTRIKEQIHTLHQPNFNVKLELKTSQIHELHQNLKEVAPSGYISLDMLMEMFEPPSFLPEIWQNVSHQQVRVVTLPILSRFCFIVGGRVTDSCAARRFIALSIMSLNPLFELKVR